VRITDGKIAGVEEIAPEDRAKSVDTLRKIVSGDIKPEEGEQILGVRSGVVQNYQAEDNNNLI
jgi:hypothetical protein